MISISKKYSFDSGHQLKRKGWSKARNEEVFGKCYRKHGHTYTLTVEVTGPVDSNTGMILNYFDLDKIVKPYVDDVLDHQNLNEVFPDMITTAENMVEAIGRHIQVMLLDHRHFDIYLASVTLSETPKTTAKWTPI